MKQTIEVGDAFYKASYNTFGGPAAVTFVKRVEIAAISDGHVIVTGIIARSDGQSGTDSHGVAVELAGERYTPENGYYRTREAAIEKAIRLVDDELDELAAKMADARRLRAQYEAMR